MLTELNYRMRWPRVLSYWDSPFIWRLISFDIEEVQQCHRFLSFVLSTIKSRFRIITVMELFRDCCSVFINVHICMFLLSIYTGFNLDVWIRLCTCLSSTKRAPFQGHQSELAQALLYWFARVMITHHKQQKSIASWFWITEIQNQGCRQGCTPSEGSMEVLFPCLSHSFWQSLGLWKHNFSLCMAFSVYVTVSKFPLFIKTPVILDYRLTLLITSS